MSNECIVKAKQFIIVHHLILGTTLATAESILKPFADEFKYILFFLEVLIVIELLLFKITLPEFATRASVVKGLWQVKDA